MYIICLVVSDNVVTEHKMFLALTFTALILNMHRMRNSFFKPNIFINAYAILTNCKFSMIILQISLFY